MNISKSQKTMRVLYLYLTIPLLIVTMVLTALALMSATGSKKETRPEVSVEAPKSAAGSGSADAPASGLARPAIEIKQPEAKKEDAHDTTAGQAAIVAAITTGITGLLGAIMQTIVAFLKAKEKRRQSEDV
jgi:hypothetical protein